MVNTKKAYDVVDPDIVIALLEQGKREENIRRGRLIQQQKVKKVLSESRTKRITVENLSDYFLNNISLVIQKGKETSKITKSKQWSLTSYHFYRDHKSEDKSDYDTLEQLIEDEKIDLSKYSTKEPNFI